MNTNQNNQYDGQQPQDNAATDEALRQRIEEAGRQVNQQADQLAEKKLSRRKRRKQQMEDEAVEYYYDDDAAARRAGIGCLIAILVVLAIIGGVMLYGWGWYSAETNGRHATATGTVQVTIASTGASAVGGVLEDNGLIGNSMIFRLYSRYFSEETPTFSAGEFELQAGMSYDEMIDVLTTPQDTTIEVRIREGVTIMSIANQFEELGFGTSEEFLAIADDLERFSDITFIAKLLEDFDETVFHRSEGYLYPDTYTFDKNDSLETIIRTLYQTMDSKFTDEMYARMDELGISLRETITLASLVQAESGFESENEAVAGVFWNRLNNSSVYPYLESDVTLRYVKQWMQWNYDEYSTMRYADINYEVAREVVGDDLYYAYVTLGARAGLPTGPICSVTLSSINAALYPAEHGYYFFVTDAYNNYYYGTTLQEHEANIVTANEMNAQYEQEQAASASQTEENEVAG